MNSFGQDQRNALNNQPKGNNFGKDNKNVLPVKDKEKETGNPFSLDINKNNNSCYRKRSRISLGKL